MPPKISVIIPVYNVEKYLRKCIHSVLSQTYGNLEIILVDDGSTDNSGIICDELSQEDERIIVIHQNNRGLSAARNRGLDIATGEYIAFVDSDDCINVEMYRILVEKIQIYDADMAVCCYMKWQESKDCLEKPNISYKEKVLSREEMFGMLFLQEFSVLVPVAWNKLYRRKLWDEIRYPEGRYHEDEYVIHHLINQCEKVVMIPESLYHYSIRGNSIMTTRNLKASRDWIGALLDRKLFFDGLNNDELSRKQQCYCVRMILWECKQIQKIDYENREFIREMSKQIKALLKERPVKESVGARIFTWMPILYIRCSRFFS